MIIWIYNKIINSGKILVNENFLLDSLSGLENLESLNYVSITLKLIFLIIFNLNF